MPDNAPLSRLICGLRCALWAGVIAGYGAAASAQSEPVADSATAPRVEAMPLGLPGLGGAGLLSPKTTGLPATLWLGSDPERLRSLIRAAKPTVPALRDLLHTLMLAEADPPAPGADGIAHLGARLDWLIALGAVEEALALIDIAGHDDPQLFARWADLNLLLGQAAAPCAALRTRPGLSDDLSMRIFCTAREGDWQRASLLLTTAATLGDLAPRQVDLLERFLDNEIAEERPPLIPPVRPTALEFRLFEALGEPLPTAPLPLAYSVLDLGGDNGWRAQIEAAERLARVGAVPANRLLGLYTLREPAASGGVWDRVEALQRFEATLSRGAPDAVSLALPRVWSQMASAGLLVPFSELFADRLARLPLSGRATRMAARAGFLSPGYEDLSLALGDEGVETRFLTAIARGQLPPPAEAVDLPHAAAVAAGFAGAPVPEVLTEQLQQGRLGEVILRAVAMFASGAEGNSADLTDALATFRAVGLENIARRAALQIMLLDAERARR
ncbi:hypothetical protein [Tropicibacter oceani]|uniref:Antifreeze glycopeptide polyprotein n=1 Tax=Tropicibacter oceani TaxID=3058420 RepID=A0ABY8QDT2_9RHOB|nr:hypothetical protein [Tropicibacter oceani]WGW02786.1 hypothetical protein QF118_12660 [Tropicibacter oceani]